MEEPRRRAARPDQQQQEWRRPGGRARGPQAQSYCIIRSDKLRRTAGAPPSRPPAQGEFCDGRQAELAGASPAGASGADSPPRVPAAHRWWRQQQAEAGEQRRGQIVPDTEHSRAGRARVARTHFRSGRPAGDGGGVGLRPWAGGARLASVLLVLVAGWLATLPPPAAGQQYKPEWPQKVVEQEIFLLNLEDGYFGCQVNASQDFLQLFELSRLCDGQTQCYLGSDELEGQLKCRDRDRCEAAANATTGGARPEEHVKCVNGVCLDGLCYCNDGFGGKSCDIPDENECKFRPCDVFAHCTNTMGSYYCSCFPGYDGDGMRCQDINECEIPSLRALCSDNSECVNLPGHFVCKCKPGYQQSGLSQSSLTGAPIGNSTVQCTDIDECSLANACGKGALCENLPGSFRCACPAGFTGDPTVECIDMDECRNNPCGLGAQCTNIPGGFRCSCAPGHERNPAAPPGLFGTIQLAELSAQQQQQLGGGELANATLAACLDVNECLAPPGGRAVCGAGAQCVNTQGGYFCQCPPGFNGNPKVACVDIDECASHACGPNAQCKNVPGSYQCECKPGYTGNAYLSEGCQDEDECLRKDACGTNAQCFNTLGAHQCTCLSGFAGDPYKRCADIDECATGAPCGAGAQCQNLEGGYKCGCPDKFLARGTPDMGCERAAVDVSCSADADCTQNALCLNATCQCKLGFQISGIECVDVDECLASPPAAPAKPFTRLTTPATPAAGANLSGASLLCGAEALCLNLEGSYRCDCKPGYEKLDGRLATSKCRDVNECERAQPCGPNSKCFNTDGSHKCLCNDGFVPVDQDPASGCKSPCDGVSCGQHAACKPHGEEAACVCKPGFTFDPSNIGRGCVDIDECDTNYGPSGLCGQRAVCTNVPGSYRCHCPAGFAGDAYRYCEDVNECDRKFGVFGQCGELAVCTNKPGSFACACGPGYTGDPRVKCTDVDECAAKFGPSGKCGVNAICVNSPGRFSCQCPPNHSGDPNVRCTPEQPPCASAADCAANQVCQAGRCSCPFAQPAPAPAADGQAAAEPAAECRHPCERTECGEHATCQLDSDNQPLCVCDSGFMAPSDGRSGCVDVNECIQGVTLAGVTPLNPSGAVALGPAGAGAANSTGGHPCGRNALCRNQPGSFDCVCPPGYSGDAYVACQSAVRSQTGAVTSTTTATSSQQQQQQQTSTTLGGGPDSEPLGNYQQEPRTTSCAEPCPRGHACADGKCVRRDSCRDNQDCLASQACEHVNQALGFQCVNVCDGLLNQCGPGARCSPHNHKPICACNATAGFAGNPYDLVNGCRPPQFEQPASSTQPPPPAEQKFSSLTATALQDQLDQRRTTASQGDISTVSFDYGGHTASTPPQQVPTNNNKFALSMGQSVSNQSASAMSELQRQQVLEQQQPGSSPGLIAYEVPLPTTPLLPNFESGTFAGASRAPQARPTSSYEQQLQNFSSAEQKDLTRTTQSLGPTAGLDLFSTTRRKPPQQQEHAGEHTEANRSQEQQSTTKAANQFAADLAKTDEFLQQTLPQAGQNRSATTKTSGSLSQAYKQVACTSDQHCPGNLLCLAAAEFGLVAGPYEPTASERNQKTCRCPAEYRREGDLCFMHRINCTSSSVCRPREECVGQAPPARQQQQQLTTTISQQFALTGSGADEYSGAATTTGICICPRGYKLTPNGVACVDRNECDEGTPCALGAICQNKVGSYECVCPPGTVGEPYTKTCEPLLRPDECQSNQDCALDRECDLGSRRCVSPCHVCGPRAICTAANHAAICLCPPRYTGNAIDQVYGCQEPPPATTTSTTTSTTSTTASPPYAHQQHAAGTTGAPGPRGGSTALGVPSTTLLPASSGPVTTTSNPLESTTVDLPEYRTIPPTELFVMCLADGIHVDLQLEKFDGIIYVKGHSQDPKCRKLVMSNGAPNQMVDFKVQFGHCDLIHRDGEAGFVLVIQKHPKLVTYRARAYHVKCVYNTGERTVTLGFNVSMITTSGTIANTGPPPTCLMSIAALDGREVTSAEIGQDLLLRVDVQPDSIYGGFARSCEAKTVDDEGEYQYEVTDANGCATDPSIFSDWKFDEQRKSLVARFNAFKFPSSNNLRFQCNIRVCFGSCPPANCNGVDAYGKRRRRRAAPALPAGPNSTQLVPGDGEAAADEPEEVLVADTYKEGALREEIMVQSNAILTFDRKEEASLAQRRPQPVEDIEFLCLPRLGVVMSIMLTCLLGLLAMAIAISCWCFAKQQRRRRTDGKACNGPLPHPSDFPNPLMRSTMSLTHAEQLYGP